VERSTLKVRDYQLDLTSRVGRSQVIGLNTPLSQQAGYYCSVCDCVLRDSQSYLDHINGAFWFGVGWFGGGWGFCFGKDGSAPSCVWGFGGSLGGGVCCSLGLGAARAAALVRLRVCACVGAAHVRARGCKGGPSRCAQLTPLPVVMLPPPAGKYHNRALGMSMAVEKSTVEQVGPPGAASRRWLGPPRACQCARAYLCSRLCPCGAPPLPQCALPLNLRPGTP
jgi:hypothetical protein